MASPKDFAGSNKLLKGPPGYEDRIGDLPVYNSGVESISRWALSREELQAVVESGDVWVSVAAGSSQPPMKVSGFPLMELRDENGKTSKYDPDAGLIPRPVRIIEFREEYSL